MTGSLGVRRSARLAATLTLAGVTLAACFSDRAGVTETAVGECPPISVDSDAVGSVLVAIRDFRFVPDTIRVAAGTRITWINCEPDNIEAHTVTSDEGVWDSPLMERGGTFTRVFDQTGEFPYHCRPHPFMTATVIVE